MVEPVLKMPDGYLQMTVRIPKELVRLLENEGYDLEPGNRNSLFVRMIEFAALHPEFDGDSDSVSPEEWMSKVEARLLALEDWKASHL